MLSILSLLSFATVTLAEIGSDLNCTKLENGIHIYLPSAFSCSNILSDESCALVFPSIDSKPITAGSSSPRPSNCYRNLKTLSPDVVQRRAKGVAVSFCPRTCGFCCQTDEVKLKVKLGEFLGV